MDRFGKPVLRSGSAQRRLLGQPADGPASERAGELGYVFLTIAGAHSQCVQLKYLARQILVQAALLAAPRCARTQKAVGPDRFGLIEIKQHRGMALNRAQHIAETSQQLGADCFKFERPGKAQRGRLVDRHGKMVRPEMHQSFHKRGRAGQCGSGSQPGGFDIGIAQRAERSGQVVLSGLHLGAGLRGFLLAITPIIARCGQQSNHCRSRWGGSQRGGAGLVGLELRFQPGAWICGGILIPQTAQTKAVERAGCLIHALFPSDQSITASTVRPRGRAVTSQSVFVCLRPVLISGGRRAQSPDRPIRGGRSTDRAGRYRSDCSAADCHRPG